MDGLAWRLSAPAGSLALEKGPVPEPRAGTVLVRMEAVPILSYLKEYAAGRLPYWYPPGPFTPGTNGVGIVEAVGADVYHLDPGQRVAVHPHLVANEMSDEPAQILIGMTGISADSGPMLAAWRDGTLAEHALMPAATVAPLEGLEKFTFERLATLGKFAVPLGGLLRGRLAPGETLIVSGATGYFGSAAVLLGLALGAERVIAAGRSREVLDQVARVAGARVVPVQMTGNADADTKSLRDAASGRGAHLAFDQVGEARDASGTLAALKALRRGGRLVLMGSMTVPLTLSYSDVLINDWEIVGNFMYPLGAYQMLVRLVRSGLLDLEKVHIRSFALDELPAAIDRATQMRGLDCVVVCTTRSASSAA